jgi:hypothetical protein
MGVNNSPRPPAATLTLSAPLLSSFQYCSQILLPPPPTSCASEAVSMIAQPGATEGFGGAEICFQGAKAFNQPQSECKININ